METKTSEQIEVGDAAAQKKKSSRTNDPQRTANIEKKCRQQDKKADNGYPQTAGHRNYPCFLTLRRGVI